MIINPLIKKPKISKAAINRAWWNNLNAYWQDMLLLNYKMQDYYKTWFLPYFDHYPKIIYLRSDLPAYDDYVNDEIIEKIRNIRFLDCKYMHLKDLNFISNFHQLEYLDCSHNELKDLDAIKNLKKLKHLDISYCPYLENIEGIKGFTQLRILILHGLPFIEKTKLPASFDKLKILSIGSSKIEFTQKTAENLIELCVREINLPLFEYKKLEILKLKKEEDDIEIFTTQNFLSIKEKRDLAIKQRKNSITDKIRHTGIYEDELVDMMLAFRNKKINELNVLRAESIFEKYKNPAVENTNDLNTEGSECPPLDIFGLDDE